ncbi:hypothetical protein L345_15297, partial [Ophiophagus hannah]
MEKFAFVTLTLQNSSQHPGQPLKLFLTEFENYSQGFHAAYCEGDKSVTFNLEKDVIQLKDSAVYFCAIRDTMRESRRGANQKQEQRITRGSTGQSVIQTSGILTVTEGQPVSLNCFFEAQSGSINFPFWYIQHAGQPPELLLNEIDNKTQGFQAIHHKNVIISIPSLSSRQHGGSTGQSVKQASGTVAVTEGQAVSLHCSYEAQYSGTINTYWYIQHPGQPLKLLLTEYENYGKGFRATHHKGNKNGTYNLEEEASQLKDSAVYFCAIRDTMRESRRGANQKQEKRIK